MLALRDANRIVLAALLAAADMKWNVAVAVVDDNGHLISLQRMDGTPQGSERFAEEKARAAMHYKRPTKALEDDAVQGRSVAVILLEGGLPLIRDGVYVGAIGISGAKSSEDGLIAERGAAAL
jgi:uncharacterized protein GlcG (DUF336 family)